MVSTIAAKISADMRTVALAVSQGMHVVVGDFNLHKADCAAAVQDGLGDRSAHQIGGDLNRDFGMCVGTGVKVEVKWLLNHGGGTMFASLVFFFLTPSSFRASSMRRQ